MQGSHLVHSTQCEGYDAMSYSPIVNDIDTTMPVMHEKNTWSWSMLLTTLLFLVCILISIAPLQRMAESPLLASLPLSHLLMLAGSWLPANLHMVSNVQDAKGLTGNGEFLTLIVLAFILYGVDAWIVRYHLTAKSYSYALLTILSGTIVAGLLFVAAPALPSHDVFIYADYGRAIVSHGANPYFVPPVVVSPHDPITALDDWKNVPAAYGPFWLAMCAFFALFLGDNPVHYVFAFRLLGLLAHVLNTLLVIGILHTMGRSRRTILPGALLYGYNPLVLMESCIGPHNDVLMVTCMLAGVYFALRTTRLTELRSYLLPVILMSLAVLIKFTSAPLLLFFGWLLLRRTLLEAEQQLSPVQRWRHAIVNVILASIVSCVTVLLFYGPFWIGHSVSAIVHSFSSPPSASAAENSIMRSFVEWVKLHGVPAHTSLAYYPVHLLSEHGIWNDINVVTLLVTLLAGAVLLWRNPTMRNVVFATLFTFEAILVVTPWFYPWYTLWIVGLAIVLLQSGQEARSFVAFALVFSITTFFAYLFGYYLMPFAYRSDWLATRVALTIVPPLLVFFGMLLFHRRSTTKGLATQGDE